MQTSDFFSIPSWKSKSIHTQSIISFLSFESLSNRWIQYRQEQKKKKKLIGWLMSTSSTHSEVTSDTEQQIFLFSPVVLFELVYWTDIYRWHFRSTIGGIFFCSTLKKNNVVNSKNRRMSEKIVFHQMSPAEHRWKEGKTRSAQLEGSGTLHFYNIWKKWRKQTLEISVVEVLSRVCRWRRRESLATVCQWETICNHEQIDVQWGGKTIFSPAIYLTYHNVRHFESGRKRSMRISCENQSTNDGIEVHRFISLSVDFALPMIVYSWSQTKCMLWEGLRVRKRRS